MKITVLEGSPRKEGNTSILAKAFVDGIDLDRHDVETIKVCDLDIRACIGCNKCEVNEHNKCVFDDDMTKIYEILTDTDLIVIATPLYFYGVSAQLKCLIDRLHNPIRKNFKIKKAILIGVAADSRPAVFDSLKVMYLSVLDYFGIENMGILTVNGFREAGSVAGDKSLDAARRLGATL